MYEKNRRWIEEWYKHHTTTREAHARLTMSEPEYYIICAILRSVIWWDAQDFYPYNP
jgi:hypothetical protein